MTKVLVNMFENYLIYVQKHCLERIWGLIFLSFFVLILLLSCGALPLRKVVNSIPSLFAAMWAEIWSSLQKLVSNTRRKMVYRTKNFGVGLMRQYFTDKWAILIFFPVWIKEKAWCLAIKFKWLIEINNLKNLSNLYRYLHFFWIKIVLQGRFLL